MQWKIYYFFAFPVFVERCASAKNKNKYFEANKSMDIFFCCTSRVLWQRVHATVTVNIVQWRKTNLKIEKTPPKKKKKRENYSSSVACALWRENTGKYSLQPGYRVRRMCGNSIIRTPIVNASRGTSRLEHTGARWKAFMWEIVCTLRGLSDYTT